MQQPAIGHDGAKRPVTLREIRSVSHCYIGDVLFRQSYILEGRSAHLAGSNLFAKLCDQFPIT